MKNYWYWLCFFLVGFSPCKGQISFQDILLEQQENVLRYLVSFETSAPCRAYIEYQTPGLPPQYTSITGIATSHQIMLIGLRPQTDYTITLHAFDTLGSYNHSPIVIQTDPLPNTIVGNIDSLYNAEDQTQGFILADARGAAVPIPQYRLYDRQGNVIWYDYMNVIGSPCIGYNFSFRNSLLQPWGDCKTVLEINLLGDTLQLISLDELSVDLNVHHDILLNSDTNLVVLTGEARTIDRSSIGGPPDALVVGDTYVEMAAEGNLLDYWSTFDHLDAISGINNGSFWATIFGVESEDWTHANSLAEDVDGNYLMSLNGPSQVIKINRITGEVMWTLGQDGDFSIEPQGALFYKQHTFTGLGDNRYMLFDNQGAGFYSRATTFELDTTNNVAEAVAIEAIDSTYLSGIVSSAYQLPNGNTLICFGRIGTVVETNAEGEVVWFRDEGNIINYRAFYVPYLYAPIPSIALVDSVTCDGENTIPFLPLTSLPGGFFTGPGIVDGLFDANSLPLGTHTIFYHYGWQTDTFTISILDELPPPSIQQNGNQLFTNATGSIQWYFNGTAIANANSDSFIAEISGSYQVEVKNSAGCTAISEPFEVIISSNHDLIHQGFELFPNPAKNEIWLRWARQDQEISISVYNILGQRIRWMPNLNGEGLRLPLGNCQPGTYILHWASGSKNYVQPFIVKK